MSYSDFTLELIQDQLKINIEEKDLFAVATEHVLSTVFKESLQRGVNLALAVNTEKAKSEFIIAQILLEIKLLLSNSISIFSGIELNVDTSRGLNGFCDFIISKDKRQHLLTAPLLVIVEAKNDNLRTGLGQCIAEMYAAQCFNLQHEQNLSCVYGVVTTGSAWKFLQLAQQILTLDIQEYFINEPEKLIGIFLTILVEQ